MKETKKDTLKLPSTSAEPLTGNASTGKLVPFVCSSCLNEYALYDFKDHDMVCD